MKIACFITNAGSNSGKPGATQNTLRLSLAPKSDLVDDPNAAAFPDEKTKSGSIELQGLSDELMAQFRGGQRCTVTIEVEK